MENLKSKIENKKILMLKTLVLAENALKTENISENMFYRIKALN